MKVFRIINSKYLIQSIDPCNKALKGSGFEDNLKHTPQSLLIKAQTTLTSELLPSKYIFNQSVYPYNKDLKDSDIKLFYVVFMLCLMIEKP